MHPIPSNSPSNVVAIDEHDPNAGGACHAYAIQFRGPTDVCIVQFQHGPRAVDGSIPGVFDDDLLAIVQDRLEAFQQGPFACPENECALNGVRMARQYLGHRVAARVKAGVLGLNEKH